MRADAPEIRSIEQLQRKYEQVLDATERGVLTPKQIDGLNTTLKQIKALGIDVPLRLMSLIAKFGRGSEPNIPVPRGTMIRSMLNLPPEQDRKKLFMSAQELQSRSDEG